MLARVLVAAVLVGLGSPAFATEAKPEAKPRLLKFATLAPDGTTWTNGLKSFASMVSQGLSGQLKIKLIANGIAGDERQMLDQMRQGKLNGAALTALGLGTVSGTIHVLELPMLVRDYAELDHLREKLDTELRKSFEDKGFVVLAWSDLGPVHIFTTKPIKTHRDLTKAKPWVLPGDRLIPTLLEELGLKGVPMPVGEVNAAMEKGTITLAYGSALTTLALGWHAHLRYMFEDPFSFGVAATVLSKRDFDALTPEQQMFLLVEAKAYQRDIVKQIRDEDARAMENLKRTGVQVIRPSPELAGEFAEVAKSFLPQVEPLLFSPRLRKKAESILEEYRNRPKRAAKSN